MEISFVFAALLHFVQTCSELPDLQCLTSTRPFWLALIRVRGDMVCMVVKEMACKNILHYLLHAVSET